MPYNWPVKIKKYDITCPYQRVLVAKYESIIDWNGAGIRSAEALDRYIRMCMLPALKTRIDPCGQQSNYCQSIDLERILAQPADHIHEAMAIREAKGDEAVTRILLAQINAQKQISFEAWWAYLTRGNLAYAETAAFQYLLLRPVIDSSGAKSTRAPVHPNAEALAQLFEQIAQETILPDQNLLRAYCAIMAFGHHSGTDGHSHLGVACGWITIPGKSNEAANRVAALARGSGWCVASPHMAAYYLSRSDFHILLDSGTPVVAIRMACNMAVEIRGRNNEDPGPWWPRIILYLMAYAFRVGNARAARELRGYASKLAESRAFADTIAALAASPSELTAYLQASPATILLAPRGVMRAPEHRAAVQAAWLACLISDPACIALAPEWFQHEPQTCRVALASWATLVDLDPLAISRMPDALQQREDFVSKRARAWCDALRIEPQLLAQCPETLRHDADTNEAVLQGWTAYLKQHPTDILRMPEVLVSQPAFAATRAQSWRAALRRDISLYARCPADLQDRPDILNATIRGGMNAIKRRRINEQQYATLCKVASTATVGKALADFKAHWKKQIEEQEGKLKGVPAFLLADTEFRQHVIRFWRNPYRTRDFLWSDWSDCPAFVKSDPEIAKRAIVPIRRQLRVSPMSWQSVSSPWRSMPELREEAAQCWASRNRAKYADPPADIRTRVTELRGTRD